jgi:hypothetical protein
MRIEIETDAESVTIDTDTADREELAKALIALHGQWEWLDKAWDRRAETLTDAGLDFIDGRKKAAMIMVDSDKAFASFRRLLTDFIEEGIDRRRQAQIEALEAGDD